MVGIKFFVRSLFIVSLNASVLFVNDPLKEVPTPSNVRSAGKSWKQELYIMVTVFFPLFLKSWSACEELCKETVTCKYFSSLSKCIPKSGEGRSEGNSDAISGTWRCGAEIISTTADITQNNLWADSKHCRMGTLYSPGKGQQKNGAD